MEEVEQKMAESIQDDYNGVLNIFDPIDSTKTNAYREQFEYIIKKASLPIKWHKSSQYVDNCYNLIGRTRLYRQDYENALDTYKYVFANNDDANSRHEALVWMMRLFVEKNELKNMQVIKQAINEDSAPFNDENAKVYHLTMAQYYKIQRDYPNAIAHLSLVPPLEKNRTLRARYYFILGQMHKRIDGMEKAHQFFAKASKINTNYEMEFLAALNAKVTQPINLSNTKENKKLSKYFQKELKDLKNWDLRDRIYYQMAAIEMRRPDTDQALKDLNESIQISTKDKVQKGYSYLMSGKIYYEDIGDYEKAAAYYDSAMKLLPEDMHHYEMIAKRADYLKDLAKYTKIIREQDRLLSLSAMNEEERDSVFRAEMAQEKDAIIEKEAFKKINEQRKTLNLAQNTVTTNRDNSNSWYFYNPNATVAGSSQFLRTWGSRPLEDNWRRSRKQSVIPEQKGLQAQLKAQEEKEKAQKSDLFASIKSVDERRSEIPHSEADLSKIREKLGDALFNLSKVYLYKIEDFFLAQSNGQRLIDELPAHEYTPEMIYTLYTSCPEEACNPEIYKQLLIEQYPESFYAKILVNPDYVYQNNLLNKVVEKKYQMAYKLYNNGNYNNALVYLDEIDYQYPKNRLQDKVGMLRVLVAAKTAVTYKEYKDAIDVFLHKFPESEFAPRAKEMLELIPDGGIDARIPGRKEKK
ncbi:hypothetical protein GCM10023331_37760 [Algivirga pacifica]|uniref:Tetratricopeptide repeat-containing protein n=2 Tax=Algivirga pacifica TaxID=1162670 RepID=A0ABP9DK35_9BACT